MINPDILAANIINYLNYIYNLNPTLSHISNEINYYKLPPYKPTGWFEISTDIGSSFTFEITETTPLGVALSFFEHCYQTTEFASNIDLSIKSKEEKRGHIDNIKKHNRLRAKIKHKARIRLGVLRNFYNIYIPPGLLEL